MFGHIISFKMKFLTNVTPLTRRVHITTLRSLNRSQNRNFSNNFALFHSQSNSMKIEDCVNKDFEANWREFRKKITDVKSIFPNRDEDGDEYDYDDYYERDDEKLEILYNELKKDNKFDIKIVLDYSHGNNASLNTENSAITLSHPILAHRSILSASSPVFKRFLSAYNHTTTTTNATITTTTTYNTVIELYDIDKETIKELMLFMYTLQFSDDVNSILKKTNISEKLLYTALKYEITDLKYLFDELLSKVVNNNNIHALGYLGQVFNLTELLEACKEQMENDDFIEQQLKSYALQGLAGGDKQVADLKGHNSEGQSKVDSSEEAVISKK